VLSKAISYDKRKQQKMEKKIKISSGGMNARVGHLLVNRLIPNHHLHAVGPFVFLDHLYPTEQKAGIPKPPTGEAAHPHRGIATFSYLFSGALQHYDSRGHHGIVTAGGAQWMKAGNGVIHDENPAPDFVQHGGILHGLQFWINLPAKNKAELPDYLAVQPADMPITELPDDAGTIKVLIGTCGVNASPVTTFLNEFMYHITLNPKASFTYPTKDTLEYAAFIPSEEVKINGTVFSKSEVVAFEQDNGDITFSNNGITQAHVILFGGSHYSEPIVAEGPFVMNSSKEIAAAYGDFFDGKYGEIRY
jgi:redox-sensitive bicupin YhaK (pirin superfamily)